jgi:hypothetical protein
MVRFVSTISAFLLLFAPLAAAAQQLTLDQIVQQLFPQGLQGISGAQATSTIGTQLQQNLTNFLPIAQQYLDVLNPQAGDTEAIVARLELMLKDPKFNVALQGVASTTLQAVAANPNQPLINTLLGQVATIQQQIETLLAAQAASTTPALPQIPIPVASSTATIVCPAITRLLQFGANGTDVINLQAFLIGEGLLEAGNATGFFGKLTEAAVQAWQNAKAIVTAGDPATTGFGAIGPKTRAALQNCR